MFLVEQIKLALPSLAGGDASRSRPVLGPSAKRLASFRCRGAWLHLARHRRLQMAVVQPIVGRAPSRRHAGAALHRQKMLSPSHCCFRDGAVVLLTHRRGSRKTARGQHTSSPQRIYTSEITYGPDVPMNSNIKPSPLETDTAIH